MIELSSERHDELVAIVQSSVHIMNLVLGHILEKRGIRVDELLRIATPNSRMQVCILGRFLNQKASLYTDMQMCNTRYRDEILPEMLDYFHTLHDMVQRGDTDGFESEFDAIKETVGESFLGFARSISESFDANIKRAFHEREQKRGSEEG
jgi:prephenate dehydrogenase